MIKPRMVAETALNLHPPRPGNPEQDTHAQPTDTKEEEPHPVEEYRIQDIGQQNEWAEDPPGRTQRLWRCVNKPSAVDREQKEDQEGPEGRRGTAYRWPAVYMLISIAQIMITILLKMDLDSQFFRR